MSKFLSEPEERIQLLKDTDSDTGMDSGSPSLQVGSESPAEPLLKISTVLMEVLYVTLPYFISKVGIAANTAVVEYLYGQSGIHTLEAESLTLNWEFLLMGTAMGGMRATSVLAAKFVNRDKATGRGEKWYRRLFRGSLTEENVGSALGNIANVSTFWTTLYGLLAIIFFCNSQWATWLTKDTPSQHVVSKAVDYGRGFAWGALPTLWLYNNEQFALGLRASGVALVWGCFYALMASLGAWWWSDSGAYGFGCGMSFGAWIALVLLKAHLFIDPLFRGLGLNFGYIRIFTTHEFLTLSKEYLLLAIPMGASNMAGLTRGLVVAAIVTIDDDLGGAYSAAGAYYATLEIAMLAASSCVSAVVASINKSQIPKPVRSRFLSTLFAVVFVLAILLGAMPLMFPHAFASFFGGKIYAMGSQFVEQQKDAVERFTWLNFTTYTIAVISMLISAMLHGRCVVWVPLVINAVSCGLGIVWAYVCSSVFHSTTAVVCSGLFVGTISTVGLGCNLWYSMRSTSLPDPVSDGSWGFLKKERDGVA